jgi:hypothetical protein
VKAILKTAGDQYVGPNAKHLQKVNADNEKARILGMDK